MFSVTKTGKFMCSTNGINGLYTKEGMNILQCAFVPVLFKRHLSGMNDLLNAKILGCSVN